MNPLKSPFFASKAAIYSPEGTWKYIQKQLRPVSDTGLRMFDLDVTSHTPRAVRTPDGGLPWCGIYFRSSGSFVTVGGLFAGRGLPLGFAGRSFFVADPPL